MSASTFAGLSQELETWLLAERLISPFIVNDKDGSLLVWIPAGEFRMGDGNGSSKPQHTVYLDGYYLGVYCITNRQYKKFVDETGHRTPDKAPDKIPIWMGKIYPIWKRKSYPDKYGDHPVVCVNWEDAVAYCTWAGLQLPTEAQWEKGARGPGGLIYPWGNVWDSTRCRHYLNKRNGTTCPVFEYPNGVSGYGTFNQSGNVYEWCRDWHQSCYYGRRPRENPPGPTTGSIRVFRGDGWSVDNADSFGGVYRYFMAANRYYFGPTPRYDVIGFRACLPPGQQPVR